MALFNKRLIADEMVNGTTCTHCQSPDSMKVQVYSKFLALSILFFAYGKKVQVSCTSCLQEEKKLDMIPRRTKDRIEAIVEDAKHPWFLYAGYVVFLVLILIGLINKS